MISKKAIVKNKVGLHARPAAIFVQTANKYLSDIYVEIDNKRVNAKSIMGIMSLGVSQGTEITIIARGEDEKKAIEDLVYVLENEVVEE